MTRSPALSRKGLLARTAGELGHASNRNNADASGKSEKNWRWTIQNRRNTRIPGTQANARPRQLPAVTNPEPCSRQNKQKQDRRNQVKGRIRNNLLVVDHRNRALVAIRKKLRFLHAMPYRMRWIVERKLVPQPPCKNAHPQQHQPEGKNAQAVLPAKTGMEFVCHESVGTQRCTGFMMP